MITRQPTWKQKNTQQHLLNNKKKILKKKLHKQAWATQKNNTYTHKIKNVTTQQKKNYTQSKQQKQPLLQA